MAKFERIETGIDGLYVVKPTVFGDIEVFSWKVGIRRSLKR